MSKRSLLRLLIGLNLAIGAAAVIVGFRPPPAAAQGTGLAGNYLMASGEIQDQYDALYVLDLRERTLHAFYYDKGDRQLVYSDYRELERDFRNNN